MPFDATYDAVLFDMDGVLVDSTASVERCWLQFGGERGIGPEALRAARGHGRPAREILADLLPAEQVPDALAEIERLEVEDVAGLTLLPGAAQALDLLAARAAIATSCTAPLAQAR
ncbi:MAG: HAD family hydrolase, partial [Actinomycetota bacterium]|nr:HAD family hydrolase [Actinomycetota bacterium]